MSGSNRELIQSFLKRIDLDADVTRSSISAKFWQYSLYFTYTRSARHSQRDIQGATYTTASDIQWTPGQHRVEPVLRLGRHMDRIRHPRRFLRHPVQLRRISSRHCGGDGLEPNPAVIGHLRVYPGVQCVERIQRGDDRSERASQSHCARSTVSRVGIRADWDCPGAVAVLHRP